MCDDVWCKLGTDHYSVKYETVFRLIVEGEKATDE